MESHHWTAAYFLDVVSEQQYTERWRNDGRHKEKYACSSWFHIGHRAEIEGRIEDAIAAYESAVELGKLPNAYFTANFAAYRLRVLTGENLEDHDARAAEWRAELENFPGP